MPTPTAQPATPLDKHHQFARLRIIKISTTAMTPTVSTMNMT